MLKIFIWKDVFSAYAPGSAVAIAETEEQARDLILRNYFGENWQNDPYIFTSDIENSDMLKAANNVIEVQPFAHVAAGSE